MISTVRTRPSHYERLGLKPAANADEIREAFAKEMSLFGAHRMSEAAEILIAYETLRDRAKRQDYDRSLGLGATAELRPWGFTVARPRWAPFIASPLPNPDEPVATSAAPAAEPRVAKTQRRQLSIDERASTPIGAALQDLARAGPLEAVPESQHRPAQSRDAATDDLVGHILTVGRAEKNDVNRLRSGPPAWKRVGLSLGGFVIGAGLLGAILGLSVKDNEAPANAEPAADVPTPTASHRPAITSPTPAPAAEQAGSQGQPEAARYRPRHTSSSPRPTPWAEQVAANLSAENAPADSQALGDAAPAKAVAADLPLPGKLVARTIERIGYACGEVVSTSAVEGAPGVFKVTCTSGQTYQASPVRGRYRFRRTG